MCKNGVETIINGGVYFICKIDNNACAFVRYCMNDCKLKPTSNQNTCRNYK